MKPRLIHRVSLAAKTSATMLLVVVAVFSVIKWNEARSLKDFFIDYHSNSLEKDSQRELLRFNEHLKEKRNSVKFLVTQKRFLDYLESFKMNIGTGKEKINVKYYDSLPAWFPPKSLTRAFFQSSFALLIDPYGRVREVYQGIEKSMPQSLLLTDELLPRIIDTESLLTYVDGIPFQLIIQHFSDPEYQLPVTLLFAFPIDSDFMGTSQGGTHHNHVVALLDNDNRVIASSSPNLVPNGATIESLGKEFIAVGKSFIGYGEIEMDIKFVSLVPKKVINLFIEKILSNQFKHGIIYGIAFILSSTLVVLFMAGKIKKLTNGIVEFLRNTLGIEYSVNSGGDELYTLQTSFHQMEDRIITSQNRLETITRIGLLANATLNLNEVLQGILKGTLEASGASVGIIFLKDIETGCLKWGTSIGLSEKFVADYKNKHIQPGEGLSGRIAQTGKPIYISQDSSHDPRISRSSIVSEGFNSFIGVPIHASGEIIAVMNILTRPPDILSEQEITLASAVSAHVGSAIHNARLFEERKRAETALCRALAEVERLKNRFHAETMYLQDEIKIEYNFEQIIGQSESLKKVLHKIKQVASSDSNVLILGETGTGKELVARAIHSTSSRKDRALLKVNCAALPPNLIENELFGHDKGAFTGALFNKAGRFELADGGTIFLDEIGDLPLELQAKLLRVLEEGEFERLGNPHTIKVDVRIIAVTNRNLENAVKEGDFREDLYYRLNVFPIYCPPLRDRKDDIPLLVNYFVKKNSAKVGKKIDRIPANLMASLQSYQWPGNIRELENIIERAVILTSGFTLELDELFDLPSRALEQSENTPAFIENEENRNVPPLINNERFFILKILKESNGVIQGEHGAAKRLGIAPSTLRSRMKKLGITKLQHSLKTLLN